MVSGKKHNKQKDVGKIRNKTDLARMKEYSSKLWFGTIKKTWIKSYLMYYYGVFHWRYINILQEIYTTKTWN